MSTTRFGIISCLSSFPSPTIPDKGSAVHYLGNSLSRIIQTLIINLNQADLPFSTQENGQYKIRLIGHLVKRDYVAKSIWSTTVDNTVILSSYYLDLTRLHCFSSSSGKKILEAVSTMSVPTSPEIFFFLLMKRGQMLFINSICGLHLLRNNAP